MDDPNPDPAPAAPASRARRSERLQLWAGLLGAGVTLLASGGAIAAGDHRKVVLLAFGAGLAVAAVAIVKYLRATRAPRRPAG